MVSSRSENNTIRVSVKNTTNVTKANASSINSSNPVNASNNQAKMYEQQALAHANTSKYWAEQSETSALKSENYAKQSELSANSILQNEKFIAVSENLDNINTVGENIENVITIAEDLDVVADSLDVINNVNDNLGVITSVNSNVENINTVASNIEDIQNAEENANIAKEKAQESFNYSEVSKHYSEVSKAQADIATSKTNEVVEKGNTAITEIEALGNEKIDVITVQTEIAITKASEASQSASNALKSSQNSALSEANAKESENKAKTSETNALNSANVATQQAQIAKDEVAKLSTVYKYKGSVATINNLPTNANVGDVYDTQETGMNYAWNGTEWDELGGTFDVSWGSLKGSISDNADLQTALNSKADVQSPNIYNANLTTPSLRGDRESVDYHYPRRINVKSNYIDIKAYGNAQQYGTELRVEGKPVALKSDIPTYSAGENITIENGVISSTVDLGNYYNKGQVDDLLDDKLENQSNFRYGLSIGEDNTESGTATIIGFRNTSEAPNTILIGSDNSTIGSNSVCIGEWCDASGNNSICIGNGACTAEQNSIQLGEGFNTTPNSFQVGEHQLLNIETGKIPDERLSTNIAKLTDIPDVSNFASKDELNNKQDTLTAGENITIENGVISATVPQSGGGEVEINVSAPIVLTGSQKPIENISIDDNGREYLNDKAFWSSIPELVPSIAGEDRNENLNFEDLMNTADRSELRFRKLKGFNGVYPQVNLEGYNSIKRVFSVGDIVMADKINNTVQLCFGKLDDDYTFTPRLICRLQGSSSDFYKFSKIMYLYEPSYTMLNTSSGAWDGNYYMEYGDGSFKTITYKRQGDLGGIENIYGIKFIEKDGAYSVAWVNNLGEIIELADSATFDTLDFNLVVFNNYTLELPRADVGIYGFDSTKYFVAKDTIDNVVQRLTDGEAKSISLKYNTDDFIVEEEALRINPDKLSTMPIGAIIPVNASNNYVPNGYLPCDGSEYSKAQFSDLWDNYLFSNEFVLNEQVTLDVGSIENGYLSEDASLSVPFEASTDYVFCFEIENAEDLLFYFYNAFSIVDFSLYYGDPYNEGTFLAEIGSNSKLYIKTKTGNEFDYDNDGYVCSFEYSLDGKNFNTIESSTEYQYMTGGSFIGNVPPVLVLKESTINNSAILKTITLLNTCTYSEYEADIATYGQCSKFAVDVDNEKFRVPFIKGKVLTDIADIVPVVGNGMALGMQYSNGTLAGTASASDGGITAYEGNYGKLLTEVTGISGSKTNSKSIGLTTDPVNSGIITDTKNAKTYLEFRYFVVVANGQTNQSMMDWSAWASSLQGKMNADHSNDTKPYVVEMSDKSLLPSWYKVYSNGWCEQGSYLETSATGTVTINLLKDFVNTNYGIQLTESHTGTISDARTVNKTNKTTSSFQIFRGTTAIPIYWEAKGYIR